jgi:hypothetical protein
MNDRTPSHRAEIVALPLPRDAQRALDRLRSLRDGDLGVVEITACGQRAVPALRALLLEGASSGIYQPRCRAVEALAALSRHDVLMEFLQSPREVFDPVDRTGEDAVVNAVARALAGVDEDRVFRLLTDLARTRMLAGVVEALGSLGRAEALPYLVRALGEDHTRRAAEEALGRFGPSARPALLEVARRPLPSAEHETVSSVRKRRSAVRLLVRIDALPETLRALTDDADPEIAAEACIAVLAADAVGEKTHAVGRLIELLPRLPWFACGDVERCLVDHFDTARKIVADRLRQAPPDPADGSPDARAYHALLHVARLAGVEPP